jgi:carboxypeptidase T
MGVGTAAHMAKAKATGKLLMSFELTQGMLDFPSNDSEFHNYFELTQSVENLAAIHSNIVKLSSIGRSIEGRDLHLLSFSAGGDDKAKPATFFVGGHHAREHISIETALNLAWYLATEYRKGTPRIVNLLNNRTVYIVPIANPDGAEFDVASGQYKLWRKNRKNNGGTMGVDLNRNYSFKWGHTNDRATSSNPADDTYRGPSAFSEPETQAIKAFVESHENINILLTFHTFSKLILYPWGHKFESIENQKDFQVHKVMAETMAKWNGYKPEQSSELYAASGDTTDWSYGQLGIISFTFELDPAATPDMNFNPEKGFYPGQGQIKPTFEKNIEPCLYLIEYSDNPYRVTDGKFMAYGLNSPIIQ